MKESCAILTQSRKDYSGREMYTYEHYLKHGEDGIGANRAEEYVEPFI